MAEMKTLTARKSVEMNPTLAVALQIQRRSALYPQDTDRVLASAYTSAKPPYWPVLKNRILL